MNLRKAVRGIRAELAAAGVPEPDFEAEYLVRSAVGLTRAQYLAGADASPEAEPRIACALARRLRREPAAYITGVREFYGREFAIGPAVLIPRPETEMLVDFALTEIRRRPDAIVVDVGTGSGCVAVAIAAEAPGARVVGTDISRAALAIAAGNAERHAPGLELVHGDLLTHLGHVDVVVANLPYIPTAEIDALEPEVSQWEPRVALDGGVDGFDLIRRLVADCAERLQPRILALEVGFGMSGPLVAELENAGIAAETRDDLSGIGRVVVARWA